MRKRPNESYLQSTPGAGSGNSTTRMPPALAKVVEAQRAEVKRHAAIISELEAMIPPGRRDKRHPRHRNVNRLMKTWHGVGLRRVQEWRRRLEALRRKHPHLLFGTGPVAFDDLPAKARWSAHRRAKAVRRWTRAINLAGAVEGKFVNRATAVFTSMLRGMSRSCLYRWRRNLARYGLLGMVDARLVRVVRRGPRFVVGRN